MYVDNIVKKLSEKQQDKLNENTRHIGIFYVDKSLALREGHVLKPIMIT